MIHPRLKEFVSAMSLEGLAIPKAPPVQVSVGGSPDFSIEDLLDCYRISGVSYRNGIYQVDVSKALLQSGTQEEHAQRRKDALANGSFYYTPDFPLFYGIIDTLHQNKEGSFKDQIEAARASLSGLIDGSWLMTLSRIRYTPTGQDSVIHNYGQDDQYEVSSDFVGPDGVITEPATNAAPALQALLSTTKSPAELDHVCGWFRNKDSHIWRVNSKPASVEERVARFGAGSGWSDFDWYGVVQDSDAALGVRARKIR